MRVMHIITGLNRGGAEGVLQRLVSCDKQNTHYLVSLMDAGVHGESILANGIPLLTLNMSRGRMSWKGLYKLYCYMRVIKPDLVQTWMPHANLLGGVMAKLAGIPVVIWGIRGVFDKSRMSFSTKIVHEICFPLSHWLPRFIVYNSEDAAGKHTQLGYSDKKTKIIQNGFSFETFKPNVIARSDLNAQWELPSNHVILGMVARYDKDKDHENLLHALSLVLRRAPKFLCLLIGPDMESSNQLLMASIHKYGLENEVKLFGPREDIPRLMAALDIHILSSAGESFPNVLVEAMACGTPCITTNVGDAAVIVGDTGWVVPPSNPPLLADAILDAITQRQDTAAWSLRKENCSNNVNARFTLTHMIDLFDDLWQSSVLKSQ